MPTARSATDNGRRGFLRYKWDSRGNGFDALNGCGHRLPTVLTPSDGSGMQPSEACAKMVRVVQRIKDAGTEVVLGNSDDVSNFEHLRVL
ncbi:MAG: hypothetical protein F4029_04435 [Gammaproteobacteria bacterium]|nr:hypothetical protein [Gammaproteobacteria bacterium]MYK45459.1 hypothetical protein [Gammaproteobacteria bacterium]